MFNNIWKSLKLPVVINLTINHQISIPFYPLKVTNVIGMQFKDDYGVNLCPQLNSYLRRNSPKGKKFNLVISTHKPLLHWFSGSPDYFQCFKTYVDSDSKGNKYQNYRINKKHTYGLCERELLNVFGYIPEELYFTFN